MSLQPSNLDRYLATPLSVETYLRELFPTTRPLVIFDVGACEGEDSIRYSRLFPRARILAFEPLPENCELIRKNFVRYQVTNVELFPWALSDRAGRATFHVSSGRPPTEFAGTEWNYGNKSSSLFPPAMKEPMYGWIRFEHEISVECRTLDEFCRESRIERIDFIHMDVQGAEALVLEGAARMLFRTDAIWMEVFSERLYRGQKLRIEIEEFMRGRGFALAHEEFRDSEGDQLYLNKRSLRCLVLLTRLGLRATRRRASERLVAMLRASPLYHPLRDLRRDWRLWRRARRETADWKKSGRPSPPPPSRKHAILRSYAKRCGLSVLVETGTFYGDTVFRLRHTFNTLHTIELDSTLYDCAVRDLGHLGNVQVHLGDSPMVLERIIAEERRPTLFWLDAHYSSGPTARGAKDTPIMEELLVLFRQRPSQNVVLIDDARLFNGTDDYPTIAELHGLVAAHRPQATLEVQDDIIRIMPV